MCLLHYCSIVSSLWWLNNWEKWFPLQLSILWWLSHHVLCLLCCVCVDSHHLFTVWEFSLYPLYLLLVTACMFSHGRNGSLPLYCSIFLFGSHMDAKTRTLCACSGDAIDWLGQYMVQVFVPLALCHPIVIAMLHCILLDYQCIVHFHRISRMCCELLLNCPLNCCHQQWQLYIMFVLCLSRLQHIFQSTTSL
jgi:hypothetical protein